MRGKRLEWIDAMRGFTMILVVSYHVAQVAFGQNEKTSASLPFLVLFRMPLFFFVSGFLAYRSTFQWTVDNVAGQLWKKLKIQVLPALVFLSIYVVLRLKGDFWTLFCRQLSFPTKGGYWFTWVLLQMYLIYYICLVPFRSSKARGITTAVLWLVSVAIYSTVYMPRVFTYHKAAFFQWSSLIQTMKFMQFFLLGSLVHQYWQQVKRLFDTRWFFPLVTVVAFFCCADIFRWHTLKFMWTNLPRTMAMYSLLMMVVMTFRHYQASLTRENPVGRVLQYIGTRTLDIYLLHFILMPSIPEVGKWLNAHQPNFLVDVLFSLAVAMPVIALCCLVSHVLRVSPIFREYLFGRKG